MQRTNNLETREGRALEKLGYKPPPISHRALIRIHPEERTPNQPLRSPARPARKVAKRKYRGRPVSYGSVHEIHSKEHKHPVQHGATKHHSKRYLG